jgi:nucleotide-binding universal stress UspA family protein
MLLYAPEQDDERATDATGSLASADASRRVLVGVDGSEESRVALLAAMERAGPDDTIFVVHAYPPVSGWLGSPLYQRALNERLDESRRIMDQLAASIATTQAEVSFEHHEGRPAEVLIRLASLRDVDEIVVGQRQLGRLRAFARSVSRALLRTANRPVLIVPTHATAA